ncbi:MAG TPA: hypothetical protein VNO51_14565 [Ilumatobacteraceae bacterium]|nr:hypothetical protein [Ilumatobacteraceae bacterium]
MPHRPAETDGERSVWWSWLLSVAWLPWMLRITWIAVAAVGWPAVSSAVGGRSDAVDWVATVGSVVAWIAGVVAMAIPATVSLTAVRVIVPLAPLAGLATLVGGGDTADGVETIVVGTLATLVAMSGEVGKLFVQASAYGDEERLPLRPPFGFAIAAVLAWVVWAGAVMTGPLLLAAKAWVPGGFVTALAIVAMATLPRRWHQLSRRWLVLVPAGLALHDPVVLGETLMLRRSEVARIRLAPADTEAADLTGPATGNAIEVGTASAVTAHLAPTRQQPRGRAIHLTAFLTSPTRPGRALLAAGKRHLPVG